MNRSKVTGPATTLEPAMEAGTATGEAEVAEAWGLSGPVQPEAPERSTTLGTRPRAAQTGSPDPPGEAVAVAAVAVATTRWQCWRLRRQPPIGGEIYKVVTGECRYQFLVVQNWA